MHLVIIGNSAAGLAAAKTARQLKPSAKITIITDESGPAYARCLIPDLLAGNKDIHDIGYVNGGFYRDCQIELLSERKVIAIEIGNRRLRFADGGTFVYDRLLVATGASPIKPRWPGSDLPGIFTFRKASQALQVREAALNTKSAVVVGGGLVSLKAAHALKSTGVKEVIVVVKSPHLLIKQLDSKGASLIEKELIKLGIKFIYDTDPVAIEQYNDGVFKAVHLENGQILDTGLVLIGKGVRPNQKLVEQAGGIVSQGVVVNKHLETSIPDVYAAGDCIEVKDLITGIRTQSGLWSMAVEQGRCAGYNMAGQIKIYQPTITRLNSGQFGTIPFVSVGDVKNSEDTVVTDKRGNYRKLYFNGERLVGLIMVGSIEQAGVYTTLIKKSQPLGRLKNKVIDGNITGVDLINGN